MYVLGIFVWALLGRVLIAQSRDTTCRNGWFGSPCQYKCHCEGDVSCSADGQCPPGTACARGWFGPACQYLDVGFDKSETEATDGRDDTCLSQTSSPTEKLTLTLRSSLKFTWLRVVVNNPDFLQNFTVHFTDDSIAAPLDPIAAPLDCINPRNFTVTENTLDVHCDIPGLVKAISVEGEAVRHLCSVYVSAGRNVALLQETKQVSNYSEPGFTFASGLAVDGITSGKFKDGSCTHTFGGADQSWNVSFMRPYTVSRYVIYNRDDNGYRLQGFRLESFDKMGTKVYNYTDGEIVQKIYSISPRELSKSVTSVMISVNGILTLCEVEIYGDTECDGARYGKDCDHMCNCASQNEACFVSTGGCPSGCASGYYGDACQTICLPGKYGLGCRTNCSEFCLASNKTDTSSCHHVNGSCYFGCQAGYTGSTCTTIVLPEDKTTEQEKEQQQQAETASTVGGVVAGVVIIILTIVLVIIIVVRYRRKQRNNASGPDSLTQAIMPESTHASQESGLCESGINSRVAHPREHASMDDSSPSRLPSPCHGTNLNLYYNTFDGINSTVISVNDLDSFMASKDKSFYETEFAAIPSNDLATVAAATSAENKHKNRYKNIYAYDHSRVHLLPDITKNHGDYINASYIEGYNSEEMFIASQGPTKVNLEDFVRMLWEQEVGKVVMLTNVIEEGKQKCEVYWPSESPLIFGDITVSLNTTQVFADYTIRRLELRKEGKPNQTVTHFHFTSWPDKDVPTTPWGLVDFEQRVASYHTNKPIVVHCSAGVGRTGTFIALRNVLRQAEDKGLLDFFSTVKKLRQSRVNMVQTGEQYEFLYRAARVAIMCMGTTVTMCDIEERLHRLEIKAHSGQTLMEKEFKSICSLSDSDDKRNEEDVVDSSSPENVYENSRKMVNKSKNRLSNILPREFYRAVLSRETNSTGDYINAVLVPSFVKHDQQILTQLPLPTTIVDFWRLVTQYKVSLIVAFERDLRHTDQTVGDYLPATENEEAAFSTFKVTYKQVKDTKLWRTLRVTVTLPATKSDPEPTHQLTHLDCLDTNLDAENLLTILRQIRSLNHVGAGRSLFMCRNGAEYCGLVCVLSLLLDRMDNDQCLTVPLVVGAIKAIRPQVIPTLTQYRQLYQVLSLYSESVNEYSNFFKREGKVQ